MFQSFSYRSSTAFESIGSFPLTVTVGALFPRNLSPKVDRGIPKVSAASQMLIPSKD